LKTPTVGSMPGMDELMPMPRIEKLATPRDVPMSSKETFGIDVVRLWRSRTFKASSCLSPYAVTESGTS